MKSNLETSNLLSFNLLDKYIYYVVIKKSHKKSVFKNIKRIKHYLNH